MVADESALVLVLPNDNIDAIITKVRSVGTAQVQLLVPDGAPALQTRHGVDLLRRAAERNHIGLLVITSDEQTLDAVRGGHIEAIGVEGTRVVAPDQSVGNGAPFGAGMAAASRSAASSDDLADEDILAALDDLSTYAEPATQPDEEYDAFAAELDAWSDISAGREPAAAEDDTFDPFAAELDAWGEASASQSETVAQASPSPGVTAPPPREPAVRPRIRPEDIELTADEKQRANRKPGSTLRDRREADSRSARSTSSSVFDEFKTPQPERQQRSWLMRIVPVVLLVLLLVIVLFLVFGNRANGDDAGSGMLPGFGQTTLVVTLPAPDAMERAFSDQTVPIVPPGSENTDTAIVAAPLSADATASVQGTVTTETQSPSGTAAGTILLLNSTTQAINLPQGTEFVATNAQGQEVRFAIDTDMTIPPASTSDQGAQIVTTRGQAQVGVTALAPGSASNVEANAITQILIPGQPAITVNAGGLLLQHDPLTGGSEQTVRVVTDQEIQQVLGQALVGLENQSRDLLRAQPGGAGLELEESTISPRGESIVNDPSFSMIVDPPVGSSVDPANPFFTLTTGVTYKALATPVDQPLQSQLQTVVSRQFETQGDFPVGMAPIITNWTWDGSRLTVDGRLQPAGDGTNLDAQARSAILAAVKGKSRAEAEAALQNFVEQGVIADYTLPDVEQLPRWSFQLTLEVDPATRS